MSRFCRYLLPLVLLSPVIFICGKLVFTEILVEIRSALPAIPMPAQHFERGWPLVFSRTVNQGSGLVTVSEHHFSLWALLADLSIAVAVIGLAVLWLYRRFNRPRPWRVSVRSLLIAVTLIAVALGWLMASYRSWQREQAALEKIAPTFSEYAFQEEYRGPQWLRRFVSWDGTATAGPTNSPYLALANAKEPLTIFHRVTRFETPLVAFESEPGALRSITSQRLSDLTSAFADMPYLRTVHMLEKLPFEPDQCAQWKNVERVECSEMQVDRQLMKCIASIPHLSALSFEECHIMTGATLLPLQSCRSLKWLDLKFDDTIADDAVDVLCKISSLEDLHLNTTLISDAGARRLLALPNIKRVAVPPNTSQATCDEFKDKIIDWTTLGDSEE